MSMRKLCCLLLILCLFIGAIGIVHAATEGFNVAAGQDYVCPINVSSGDKAQLSFFTTGQASSDMCFSLVLPNSTVINVGDVGQYSTSFTSNAGGTCELHFDNSNSSTPVFVALNSEVDHYILGIPEMTFVLAAIVVLIMVVAAVYIIISRPSY
jgi:hypothetical protein